MFDIQTQISDLTLRDYDLLRDESGLLDLSHVSLVSITGDDRKGWLQGQATSDLRKLDNGASNVFCLTAITGHLISVCEVWAVSDRLLVTLPAATVETVLKRVEQFVIMEDVHAEDVTQTERLLSIQGPTATSRLSRMMTLPSLDAGELTFEGAQVFALRSNRTGLGGWDLWISARDTAAIDAVCSEFKSIGQEAYNIARLEAGIPLFGSDMGERTMPPEMGKAFEERHVSYTKGCYMGQEVLMRIHSRGHTNRTWVGLISESALEIGATVSHQRRQDAGTVTSAAFSPDFGYLGAAMVRNDVAFEGEVVQIANAGGTIDAVVRQMPILR
jgi:folate-binding protein YgfZ